MNVNAYIHTHYIYIYACPSHVHGACGGQKRTSESLELELHIVWTIIRVVGSEPRSSARTVNAFNHWTTCPIFLTWYLRQALSLDMELTSSVRLARQQAPEIPCYLLSHQIIGAYCSLWLWLLRVCWVSTLTSTHLHMRTSPMEPSP